ncbi:putative pyrroloquinoline-quinone binding quinoprotein [Maribacter vaceletii]|uniref:Putative pyrroloquinoline-quinone binding quinoprotein n=1 Tax=Maribacter vaceletii TaxID=1206816 RepID=A0A495EFF2_9FLAO|nr:PQQ-binding-like beta-propeller repeat protein [Maribacter vaceletii]RKR15409.1 putative pyrroloquinoline-quinone binding quinoprotein [Maribacter vaceletii]
MKNIKLQRTISIQYLCLLTLVLVMQACSKNDDTVPTIEPSILPISLSGDLALVRNEKSLLIDLNNGNLIEETATSTTEKYIHFNENYYIFQSNKIQKTNALGGAPIWEKEYINDPDSSYKIESAKTTFFETTLFVSYRKQHNSTYRSTYYFEALDITNGNSLWKHEVSSELTPYVYKNRLITTTKPNGNASMIFQYRNKQLGHLEVERTLTERIGGLLFNGDFIYATSWQKRVFALDRELNTVWSFETEEANPRQPIILGNQFIFYSRDKHVYSLNKDTGNLNWKTVMPNGFTLEISAFNDKVYIGQQSGDYKLTVYTLNIENGAIDKTHNTAMSESYYSTKLQFYKDYLILITSPTSNESDSQIQVELIHLTSSETLWSTLYNIPLRNLETTINATD